MADPLNETKVNKLYAVRVMLDDHDYECLVEEAKQNHRVPSKQLAHQVASRYKKKRLKRTI